MNTLKHICAFALGGLLAASLTHPIFAADKVTTTTSSDAPWFNFRVVDGKPLQIRWDTPLSKKALGESYGESKQWFAKARKQKISRTDFWQQLMTKLPPHWYGTPWDYNGVSQTPNEGKIACGYFITTILRDAGFKLPRVKLAQIASETMIKRLVHKNNIRHFLRMDHETFVAKMKAWGKGVYIIGMDNHTGFLWHDGKELYFVHSSWWPRERTMKEIALYSEGLRSTQYRVVGKLSSDSKLFKAWRKGRKVGYKNATR